MARRTITVGVEVRFAVTPQAYGSISVMSDVMALYTIKEKLFSFNRQFSIDDANGAPVYYVDGKLISFGRQLTMTDTAGSEVAYIKQKLPALMATFEIYVGGQLALTVQQKLGLRPKFELIGPQWSVEGNWTGHEYDILDASGLAQGHVSKQWATLADTFTVQTPDNAPDTQVLAVVIAIDMALASNRR